MPTLSGIERLDNLRHLSAASCLVEDISALARLTSLEKLELNNNLITDIQVLTRLTNLNHLNLARNEIEDISVLSALTALKYLDIGDNSISDYTPIHGLPNLTDLHVTNQGNLIMPLEDFHTLVESLPRLEWIYTGEEETRVYLLSNFPNINYGDRKFRGSISMLYANEE